MKTTTVSISLTISYEHDKEIPATVFIALIEHEMRTPELQKELEAVLKKAVERVDEQIGSLKRL